MNIQELIQNRFDIFDQDFKDSNLTDAEEGRALELMADIGYSVGMLKNHTRVYWAPENATL